MAIDNTVALRGLMNALVARRRDIAEAALQLREGKEVIPAGSSIELSAGWQYGADIATLQAQIDAVERAISSEIAIAREISGQAHLRALQGRASSGSVYDEIAKHKEG